MYPAKDLDGGTVPRRAAIDIKFAALTPLFIDDSLCPLIGAGSRLLDRLPQPVGCQRKTVQGDAEWLQRILNTGADDEQLPEPGRFVVRSISYD